MQDKILNKYNEATLSEDMAVELNELSFMELCYLAGLITYIPDMAIVNALINKRKRWIIDVSKS